MNRRLSITCALLAGLAASAFAQVSGSGGIDPPGELQVSPKAPKPGAKGGIDLRPRFHMNEPYRLRIEQKSKGQSLVEAGGGLSNEKPEPQNQTMTQVFELRFVPKDVRPDGAATVDMVVDAVRIEFKSDEMNASFDSRSAKPQTKPQSPPSSSPSPKPSTPGSKPSSKQPGKSPDPLDDPSMTLPGGLPQDALGGGDPNQMLAQMVAPLVGSVTTLQIDSSGNVTKTSGGEAWNLSGLAGMTGAAAGQMPPSSFGDLLNMRPGVNRANVGESWTTGSGANNSPIGGFAMDTRYVLRAASGSTANIDFSGTMEPGSQGAMGMQVREATFRGDATWDTGIGFLRSMQATTHTVLEGVLAGTRARLDSTSTIDVKMMR